MRVLELRTPLRYQGPVCGPECGCDEENGSDANSIQNNCTIHSDFLSKEQLA
jgi:hypothetical protein